MRARRSRIGLLVGVAALLGSAMGYAGCATPPDERPDFGGNPAPSYAWLEPLGSAEPEVHAVLRASIDAELQARGCRPAGSGRPDFYVAYRIEIDRRTLVRSEPGTSQTVFTFHGPSYTVSEVRYETNVIEDARLIVVIADANRRELWKGGAHTKSQKSFRPDAPKTVARVFDNWPAQPDPR